MSIKNLICPQGHVTPKWLIWSSWNSNSSEILWLSWLPASLTKIRSKMNELAWRHYFPIISLWEIFRCSRQLTPLSVVQSGRKSNSSKILCMSSLPASIKRIGSKTTEKRWRHHNMSIENLIRPQGHVTPKWLIRSSWNWNSSEILWLSCLPASLTKIRTKINELAWRHHFPIISLWEICRRSRVANSIVSGPFWPKVKLLQDFMHVLVTCKYKKNHFKNNREMVETSFSLL